MLLMWALAPNPVHCLDCNLEVDPSAVPIPVDVVDAVAHWATVDGAIETLELDSGPYESFAQAQLSDLGSPVNSEGLAVRAELEKVRRCYFVLFQPLDADLNYAVPPACPGCGGGFKEYSSASFTRLLCEKCSLALVNP